MSGRFDPPTLGLGGSLSCEDDPRVAGLREKSVLGPYGPRDGLFRVKIESGLMLILNLFIDHIMWNIFDKMHPQVCIYQRWSGFHLKHFLSFQLQNSFRFKWILLYLIPVIFIFKLANYEFLVFQINENIWGLKILLWGVWPQPGALEQEVQDGEGRYLRSWSWGKDRSVRVGMLMHSQYTYRFLSMLIILDKLSL